jgi:hypothetical protein
MMQRKHRIRNLAAHATLCLSLGAATLSGAPALAQSSTSARLTGEVTDPSGAAIPNASITAVNTATNYSVTVTSDAAGNYAFNSLPVGPYKVTTTLAGFAPLVETGIVLTVAQSATLNLPMKLGNAQDTVTVTGGAEIINTTTAELSQVVDEATIKDLPLNGRDPGTLVFLSAGVTNELQSQASTLQTTNSFPNEIRRVRRRAKTRQYVVSARWRLAHGHLPAARAAVSQSRRDPGVSRHLEQLRRTQWLCSLGNCEHPDQVRDQ